MTDVTLLHAKTSSHMLNFSEKINKASVLPPQKVLYICTF